MRNSILLSMCLALFASSPSQAQTAPTAAVTGGQIQGLMLPAPGGAVFKGIPFAAPPVGDLRWREPMPVKPWTGSRKTIEYSSPCAQIASGWNDKVAAAGKEDCLCLNIWTPQWPATSKMPVMFWIHGGANMGGSALGAAGIEPPFDGESAKPERAAAQRNENVWVSKLDNETLKAEGVRLGSELTVVTQAAVERDYFAAEHGRAPSESAALSQVPKLSGWHGEFFESHRNSVFNARAFFQVGPVMPSHANQYGLQLGGPVSQLGNFLTAFSQRKVRRAVNGNVMVPLGTCLASPAAGAC